MNLLKFLPKYVIAYILRKQGASIKEIALKLYGKEEASNRVRALISYAKRKDSLRSALCMQSAAIYDPRTASLINPHTGEVLISSLPLDNEYLSYTYPAHVTKVFPLGSIFSKRMRKMLIDPPGLLPDTRSKKLEELLSILADMYRFLDESSESVVKQDAALILKLSIGNEVGSEILAALSLIVSLAIHRPHKLRRFIEVLDQVYGLRIDKILQSIKYIKIPEALVYKVLEELLRVQLAGHSV